MFRLAIALTLLCVGGKLAQAAPVDPTLAPGACVCIIAGNEGVHVYGQRRLFNRPHYDFHQPAKHVIAKAYHGECFMYTGFNVAGSYQVGFDNDGLIGWIDGAMLETSDHECPRCPKIVRRDGPHGWGGRKAKRELAKAKLPWPCVVIHRTATRHCHDKHDCMNVVKSIQRYHMKELGLSDMKNNFYVGEDGRVYAGRGWNHVGAHTDGYNQCCLGITIIDRFMDRIPKPPALDALQQLIACGVARGKIAAVHTVCHHNSVSPLQQCPGKTFITLLRDMVVKPMPVDSEIPNPYIDATGHRAYPWPNYAKVCPVCP